MGFNYTKEQQQVIELHNRNLLVSAAAGSGKTAVLVERIVRMISDQKNPVDIDRLLIVTFTKAAAAEMRERIGLAINSRLSEEPDNKHLQKQATLLHNALITTIDSFCLYVIKNNFNDIGLDPDFRVGDDGETKLLMQDSISEMMEYFFQEGNEEFYRLLEAFCPDGKEKRLEEMIQKLYEFARSYPFPQEWLQTCITNNKADSLHEMEQSVWMISGMEYIHRQLDALQKQMEEAVALCELPGGPSNYLSVFKNELGYLLDCLSKETYCEMSVPMQEIQFAKLPAKNKDCYTELADKAKLIRTNVKEKLQELQKNFFYEQPEKILQDQNYSVNLIRTLVNMAIELDKTYSAKKMDKKVLDFGDIEHFALKILLCKDQDQYVPTDAAKDYQKHFEEILIDEYQDSNLVQEYLLRSISRESMGQNNRFMVGDVKQSIYRFRLARPEIFMEKYDSYLEEDAQCQKIELSKNFRSRQEVINSVNHIFKQIMHKDLGNVEYNDKASLNLGAEFPKPLGEEYQTELILLESMKGDQEKTKRQEARYIASRIRSMVGNFMITQKDGTYRVADYRDMAILLMVTSGWDDVFKEVLEEEGIPVIVNSREGYFSTSEIQTLMNVIRVLNNPYQDIPLFGVMKSIFGGFTDDEIALIKRKKEHLYSSLKRTKENDIWIQELIVGKNTTDEEINKLNKIGSEIHKKAEKLLEMIHKYRDLAIYMPIHELILQLVRENHFMETVGALPQGIQRRANINMLIEKAKEYGQTSYRGLFHFVRYIDQLIKYHVDYGEANMTDDQANAVTIMSIHKSKGLEFPVCFLAGVNKEFNMKDYSRDILMDIDLGISMKIIDVDKRVTAESLYRNMMAVKGRLDSIGEELRLLYVAMTRAREKLIMTGSLQKAEEKVNKFSLLTAGKTKASYTDVAQASSFLDFLLLAHVAEGDPVNLIILQREETDEMVLQGHIKTQLLREELLHSIDETESDIINEPLYQQIQNQLNIKYHHEVLKNLYTKTTVSELKQAAMEQIDTPDADIKLFETQQTSYIPSFMEEKTEVSGTTRGTAYHRILELLDLSKIISVHDIEQQLDEMIECKELDPEFKALVRIDKLYGFVTSSLAVRMSKADLQNQLYREQPFVLGLPASELDKEFPSEELVLIQGIIDVYFEENGELVLADYKTDKVAAADDLIKRYRAQLMYYCRALEQLTGKKVKEKIIYSLYLMEEIIVP